MNKLLFNLILLVVSYTIYYNKIDHWVFYSHLFVVIIILT